MNEYITFEMLGSFAGMVAAVCGMTQIIKHYLDLDPKWIALCMAGILNSAYGFLYVGDFSLSGIFLMLINIIVVTGSAVGLFETVIKPIEDKVTRK